MQKKKIVVILKMFVVIALFSLINLTNGVSRKVTILEEITSDLVTLPQRAIVYVRQFWKEDKKLFFQDIKLLKEENERLKEEVKTLKEKMADYEVIVAENNNLVKQENLKESYPNYDVVIADIILMSSSNWSHVYTINKGEKDGVMPNSAVICKDGLVGYIQSVTGHTAKLVSILDAGNAVSARITRTRDHVITKGHLGLSSKNQMKVTNIPIGVSLIEGDKIETSGMGGIYPKGIVIGKIKSFEQKNNPLENEAVIESQVNFEKLETVAIIVQKVEEP